MFLALHFSGAAYLYSKSDCDTDFLPEELRNKEVMGVCYHEKFGGYFSARALVICENSDFSENFEKPKKVLLDRKSVSKLLTEMNLRWTDQKWREVEPVQEKYSHLCSKFFQADFYERQKIIDQIIHET